MSVIGSNVLAGASGSAGGGGPVYVDDVFSTYLWAGNNGALTINNGIDLAGEGGLVWLKQRTSPSESHTLIDTVRGQTKVIKSNSMSGNFTSGATQDLTSFNSNGFSLGPNFNHVKNGNNKDNVSWTFRKQKGFLDIVTYSGSNSVQTIPHSLGSEPGMIIIKNLTTSLWWAVYHRSLATNKYLRLNTSESELTSTAVWNQTRPTSTEFTVGVNGQVSGGGESFVAYVFAHDDAQFGTDQDESIIKCGSYTGNGSTNGPEINLGFEAQWIMLKRADSGANWYMFDIMRGMAVGGDQAYFEADSGNEEVEARFHDITSTGWKTVKSWGLTNASGGNYVYMAIRRPNKPPELATEVFGTSSVFTGNGSGTRTITTGGVTADLILSKSTDEVAAGMWTDRLRGGDSMAISGNQGDANSYWSLSNWYDLDVMDGYRIGGTSYTYSNSGSHAYISYAFKRAPGFMDVVAYSGTGSTQSITHNLGVIPELQIVKRRNSSDDWITYTSKIDGSNDYMYLNENNSAADSSQSVPSATAFTWTGSSSVINAASSTYISYLFATLPGISKVGIFSGNTGYAVNVPCGFTNGARFILIKRSDSAGDWYLWDTTRGIASGNDPYFLVNSKAVQVGNTDYIDPLSTGFTVTALAPAALNATGGTYIFLAIA